MFIAHRPPPTAYRIPHFNHRLHSVPQSRSFLTRAPWRAVIMPDIKVVRVGSKLLTLHATMFAPQKLLPYPAQIGINPFVQHTRNLAITASSNPHNNFSMN